MGRTILAVLLATWPLCGMSALAAELPISLPDATYAQTVGAASCAACGVAADNLFETVAIPGAVFFPYPTNGQDAGWSRISPHLSGHGPTLWTKAVAVGLGSGGGSATMTYYVQVTGPSSLQVPLILQLVGRLGITQRTTDSLNTPKTTTAGVQVQVNPNGSGPAQIAYFSCPKDYCGAYANSYSITVQSSTHVAPALPTPITLQLGSSAAPDWAGTGRDTASGTLTAVLTIDPAWPSAGAYAIRLSHGVSQP